MGRSYPVEFFTEIHKAAVSANPMESSLAGVIRSESDLFFLGLKLESCEDVIERSAIALYEIACHHPFYEGNKRTALLTCEVLLGRRTINAPERVTYQFVLDVACDKIQVGDVKDWIKRNSSLPK